MPDPLDPRDARPAARRALRAWLALQRRGALRPVEARRALERTRGDPAAALRRLCGESPGDVVGDAELDALAAGLARRGVTLVPLGCPAYPERVAAISDAAPLLAVRGDPARLAGPLVAIVGARVATRYGRDVAQRLAHALARHGVGVVSGLARGVDAAAHRGCLDGAAPTVAVLGCGPDRVYPREHERLADEIAASGAVVSELPPGAGPLPHHFPLRNRLISALAEAVVVVEARARSGSLITAEHAAEQGRDVLAVPGPVDAPASEGPNRLLREGAAPALDASDVLRAIGRDVDPALLVPREGPPASLGREGRALWRALAQEPATRDELAARFGWAPAELAQRLLPLELEGRVAEERDGRLRVVRP